MVLAVFRLSATGLEAGRQGLAPTIPGTTPGVSRGRAPLGPAYTLHHKGYAAVQMTVEVTGGQVTFADWPA